MGSAVLLYEDDLIVAGKGSRHVSLIGRGKSKNLKTTNNTETVVCTIK